MAICKVISGGQTGVDIAALRAARRAGIRTGGWCPKGWLTERGQQPELLKLFDLRETGSVEYFVRTRANVRDSDCTLIIAGPLDPGTKLTARFCLALNRSMYVVNRKQLSKNGGHTLEYLLRRLHASKPVVLNIAGNRESNTPGIENEAEHFLHHLFFQLGYRATIPRFMPRALGACG